ncbi:MAG TPA: RNA methyltransferase [Candidatus Acidoferrales bacterium]|nr:RNA methyltransferase [Candidatus Acidoferrales bacterium]
MTPQSRASTSKSAPSRAPQSAAITSRENHWLKLFRAVLHSSRPEDERIGLEGVRLVSDAVRSELELEAILASASAEKTLTALLAELDRPTLVLRTTDKLFASVAATETPQGIAALLRAPQFAFDDLLRGLDPLIVVLVGVQDPGNVGTILRSAEALGATGVIATKGAAHPYSPKSLRASAGSALRLPTLFELAAPVALAQLRVSGLQIVAASSPKNPAARDPHELNFRQPVALLIGNEGAGLPPEIERSADALIRIQLAEPVDSLNAAVAASLILYEAARQRRLSNGAGQ